MSRSDTRRLPPQEQLHAVIKALYADADRLAWAHMSLQRRTAQYDQWLAEPEVGHVLTRYMSTEHARAWIKDGPMKEYARARQGVGRYAQYGSTEGPTAAQVVSHTLGSAAVVIEGTVGVKPLHCVATDSRGSQTYVAWGDSKNFRYLVWACLNYLAENRSASAYIAVMESMAEPALASDRTRQAAIADRCSLGLKYYRVEHRKRTADPSAEQ